MSDINATGDPTSRFTASPTETPTVASAIPSEGARRPGATALRVPLGHKGQTLGVELGRRAIRIAERAGMFPGAPGEFRVAS